MGAKRSRSRSNSPNFLKAAGFDEVDEVSDDGRGPDLDLGQLCRSPSLGKCRLEAGSMRHNGPHSQLLCLQGELDLGYAFEAYSEVDTDGSNMGTQSL